MSFPGDSLDRDLELGRAVLGGCIPGSLRWRCNRCGVGFGQPGEPVDTTNAMAIYLPRRDQLGSDSLPETTWEQWFAWLQAFAEREGHARVRTRYRISTGSGFDERGMALGMWVRDQRVAHSKGALSPERTERLEQLKGWVWLLRDERAAESLDRA